MQFLRNVIYTIINITKTRDKVCFGRGNTLYIVINSIIVSINIQFLANCKFANKMLQQKTIYITAKSKYRYANIICTSTHPCLLACNSAIFCFLHSRLLPPLRRASRALTTAKTNRADNQSFILTVRVQLMRRRDHCDYLYCTHWTKY